MVKIIGLFFLLLILFIGCICYLVDKDFDENAFW